MQNTIEEINIIVSGKTIEYVKDGKDDLIIHFTDNTEIHINKTYSDEWIHSFYNE